MTIDERLEALTMSVELLSHDVQALLAAAKEHTKQLQMDGEHIRALARIAELHERRLSDLEN